MRWRFDSCRATRKLPGLGLGLTWARQVDLNAHELVLDVYVCIVLMVPIVLRFRRKRT